MLHAVVMAGGAGTRFWPASRVDRPKQLLDLTGGRTMIQATVERLGRLVEPENVLVVTNERLVEPIRRQLPQLRPDAIVGEPCKRDTAPAVGLAAALTSHRDPDATMIMMPADHVIGSNDQFQAAISHAADLVERRPQRIVTFGITPTYPADTFGYIQRGEPLADEQGPGGMPVFRVERFREKPSREVAAEYLRSGQFYWNAGIFAWKCRTIADALRQYEPQMFSHLQAIGEAVGSPDFDDTLRREFAAIQGKSIDYAVMERYDDIVVVEAPFAWDDVGNWQSLARMRGADGDGNTIVGKHLGINTRGTIVRGEDHHLIVTVGIRDAIVVHTPDATLVADRNDEESLRQIVKLLQEKGWNEYL